MQALLAAKEGCCLLLRTFQMSQEGVAEFAVISRNGRPVIPGHILVISDLKAPGIIEVVPVV
jgi:hypothetical protein